MPLNFLKGFGLIENKGEFVRGERFKRQQVAKTVGHICTRVPESRFAQDLACRCCLKLILRGERAYAKRAEEKLKGSRRGQD